MTIQITSTTDSPEAVQAALGQKAEGAASIETPSAPDAKAPEQETAAKSDTADQEAEAKEQDEEDTGDSDSDEETEESEASEKDGKPRRKSGYQKRVDKLRSRERAALERAARAEAKLEMLEKSSAGKQKTESVETLKDAAGKPKATDFETHEEFIEALTDWKVDQKEKASKADQQKSRLETEHKQLLDSHFAREKSFAEKTEDYREVITDFMESGPMISAAFVQTILESEHGPALMYELAKDPKEFERINKLSPLAVARELGRIESKLIAQASKPKEEPKKTTQAPPPVKPVGNKGGAVEKSIYDAANMSQAEYEAARAKKRAG